MDTAKKRKISENGGSSQVSTDSSYKLTPEDARKMMEGLSQEQLLGILQNAVVCHPDVLEAVRSLVDIDLAKRKLFVRGLSWETTTESFRNLFSKHGELTEVLVITDRITGKPKGYGFLTYKHVDCAILALKEPSKRLDGRMTVTHLASSGASSAADASMRKIYISNVPPDIQTEKLLDHFAQYGEIEEGPIGVDMQTGKLKGFALFVYKDVKGAQAALADPANIIDGKQLNCRLADGKHTQAQATSSIEQMGIGMPQQITSGSLIQAQHLLGNNNAFATSVNGVNLLAQAPGAALAGVIGYGAGGLGLHLPYTGLGAGYGTASGALAGTGIGLNRTGAVLGGVGMGIDTANSILGGAPTTLGGPLMGMASTGTGIGGIASGTVGTASGLGSSGSGLGGAGSTFGVSGSLSGGAGLRFGVSGSGLGGAVAALSGSEGVLNSDGSGLGSATLGGGGSTPFNASASNVLSSDSGINGVSTYKYCMGTRGLSGYPESAHYSLSSSSASFANEPEGSLYGRIPPGGMYFSTSHHY